MKPQSNLGIDWDAEPLLGVISDRELARRKGCHHTNVKAAREHRGIPPARTREDIEADKMKIRELAKRYPKHTDIAEIMGVHPSYVSRVLNGVV